jgi:DNA-directed RNA polymerase specialized sigma24 family protein
MHADDLTATASPMEAKDWLAQRFEAHRAQLRSVAFRMLGSPSEADDAVQEAWLRLSRTGAGGIDNLGGWLTTVVGRVCLDLLRVRTGRRGMRRHAPSWGVPSDSRGVRVHPRADCCTCPAKAYCALDRPQMETAATLADLAPREAVFLSEHGARTRESISGFRATRYVSVGLRYPRQWRTPLPLIRYRDSDYGGDFRTPVNVLGIETIATVVPASGANAVDERVIGTLRRADLDRLLPPDERQLRTVLAEDVDYCNTERPHPTLHLETLWPGPRS